MNSKKCRGMMSLVTQAPTLACDLRGGGESLEHKEGIKVAPKYVRTSRHSRMTPKAKRMRLQGENGTSPPFVKGSHPLVHGNIPRV